MYVALLFSIKIKKRIDNHRVGGSHPGPPQMNDLIPIIGEYTMSFFDKLKVLKSEAEAELKTIDFQIAGLQEKRKQIVSVLKSIEPGNKGTKRTNIIRKKQIKEAVAGIPTTKRGRGRGRPKKNK